MSRRNDITIDVRVAGTRAGGDVDQVRNGNRWRVAAIDPTTNRIAAERLSDGARASTSPTASHSAMRQPCTQPKA